VDRGLPLTSLPGVGPARAQRLARLGIESIDGLLRLVPRGVEVWPAEAPIAAVLERGPKAGSARIRGTVGGRSFLHQGRRRSLLRVRVEDDSGRIQVLFFNQPWLRERFTKGEPIEVLGRPVEAQGTALVAERLASPERPLPAPGSVTPRYPTTEGISQEFLGALCREAARRHAAEVVEPLAPAALAELGVPPLDEALRALHEPADLDSFRRAARRVALEPVLRLQARLWRRRQQRCGGRALVVDLDRAEHERLVARLPFTPTAGQRTVIAELRGDLARPVAMRRLLQGDVGSGKTLVGLYGCLAVAGAGGQSAFMAPTELLAEQHFDGLARRLERAGLRGALLSGSVQGADRARVLRGLARGELDVVFGTHALFGADVHFRRLAFCVIDEQHRFGVAQRRRLLDKGADCHALLMTATPIPRTTALTIYGDLDLSILAEKPPGRGAVRTRWLRGPQRRRCLDFLEERLAAGERAFWVVPRIAEGASGAPGAEARFEKLGRRPLARFGIELVHGRQSAEERTRRLARFRDGEVRLLVATTVIEVGVDVPEATVMVIESAERLGLAQLHQLRGRIGRSPRPGWCFLMGAAVAAERFRLLERTADGFEIAEADLRQRGMGDLAGVRQAGDNAEGLGDGEGDLDLLLFARERVARDAALRAAYLDTPPAPAPAAAPESAS